jgi:hypothetical protein
MFRQRLCRSGSISVHDSTSFNIPERAMVYTSTLFCGLAMFCGLAILLTADGAAAASVKIPAAAGALTIDGKLDEPLWLAAQSFSLNTPAFGAAFPAGGEIRIAACGAQLCLGARLPESGPIVGMSQGRSPAAWWREDLLVWTFAVNFNNRGRRLILTVNPLGAYSLESTSPDPGVMNGVVAASLVSTNGWTMEAAIPLAKLAPVGFVSVERVRVPRPDAPELRWQWPATNERMDFELPGVMLPARAEPGFSAGNSARTVKGIEDVYGGGEGAGRVVRPRLARI